MLPIEIQADLYRLIRTNQDKSVKSILKIIKEEMPDIKRDDILLALKKLGE